MNILERGDIYFLYRPRVRWASEQKEPPEGVDEVERLYMILSPSQNSKHRPIVIGQKRLPEIKDGGEKY